jgi:hypothetical protein
MGITDGAKGTCLIIIGLKSCLTLASRLNVKPTGYLARCMLILRGAKCGVKRN